MTRAIGGRGYCFVLDVLRFGLKIIQGFLSILHKQPEAVIMYLHHIHRGSLKLILG